MGDRGPMSLPAFRRLWLASTVSGFGTFVTLVAVQVLVVETLDGTATDVGLVNGAWWAPYLLFGLVAGVLVDRYRRRPVVVTADLARAAVLVAVPVLHVLDRLSVTTLAVLMFVFGLFSLAGDAGGQSLLPRVVPSAMKTPANARLDQSDAVSQTSGPALGGALVALLGAPVAVLVDAVSYLASGVLVASMRIEEPAATTRAHRHFGRELREGLRWVYRQGGLTALALGTHGWFVFFSVATTAFTPFALRDLDLGALGLGLVLACAGVGALLGSSVAVRLGTRYGVGRVTVASWVGTGLGIAVVALAPTTGVVSAGVVAGAGQLVVGLAMGVENANTLGYRQTVTPDELQGRTNTTIRSVNRAMVVVGAPLGGLLADHVGNRPALWVAATGLVLVGLALAASPFRTARLPESGLSA